MSPDMRRFWPILLVGALATAVQAQTPPASPAAPAQEQTQQTSPAQPSQAQPQPAPIQPAQPPATPVLPPPGSLTTPPAPPPTVPQPQTQQQPPGTTPQTGDQKLPEVGGPIDMVVTSGPVIILKGQSTWDDGFDNLMEAFQKLNAEAKRLKLATVGRPRAAFTATDDFGFKFEAMLTLAVEPPQPPQPPLAAGKDFSFGKSPDGRALKFTHSGSYDDIDTTYEAITAYLDEKGLKARNIFVEEYMTDPKTSEDPSLEMNIYVLVE